MDLHIEKLKNILVGNGGIVLVRRSASMLKDGLYFNTLFHAFKVPYCGVFYVDVSVAV